MATSPAPGRTPRVNETSIAIVGSFVIAIVLATVAVGNPFRALVLAFTDYSHTPAGGSATASTTHAPDNDGKK